jgi:hypothetical protein
MRAGSNSGSTSWTDTPPTAVPASLASAAVARQPHSEQEALERGRGVDDRESVILGRLHPAAPGRLRVIPVGPALRLLELVKRDSAALGFPRLYGRRFSRVRAPGRQGCLGRRDASILLLASDGRRRRLSVRSRPEPHARAETCSGQPSGRDQPKESRAAGRRAATRHTPSVPRYTSGSPEVARKRRCRSRKPRSGTRPACPSGLPQPRPCLRRPRSPRPRPKATGSLSRSSTITI